MPPRMVWHTGACKNCGLEMWIRAAEVCDLQPVLCPFCQHETVKTEKAGEAVHVDGTSPALPDQTTNAVISIANSLATLADIVEKRYDPRDPDTF